jgi:hypothetical protein
MPAIINSDNGVVSGSAGLKTSGANDGILVFQTSGTETARINTDSQIVAVAGTASLPALTFTGDLNTGIYSPGADRIGFAEGGVQVGEFDASGNFLMNSGYGSAAVAYGCRAWVNFNGTGTIAIRGSGNVSSLTDNGTGNYTVNFTTSMPDVNYCPVFGAEGGFDVQRYQTNGTQNTNNYQVLTGYQTNTGALIQADIGTVLVAIFR